MISLSKLEVKDGDILILKYDEGRYSDADLKHLVESVGNVVKGHEYKHKIKLTFMLLPSTEEFMKSEIIPNSAIDASSFLERLESL